MNTQNQTKKKKLLRRFGTVFSSYKQFQFKKALIMRGTSTSTFQLQKGTKGHFNFPRGGVRVVQGTVTVGRYIIEISLNFSSGSVIVFQ
jgi:hypothetical protein